MRVNRDGEGEFNESVYRRAWEVLQEGVMILDGEWIEEVNPHMCTMTGYMASELAGESILDTITLPEDRTLLMEAIKEGFTGQSRYRILNKDGTVLTVKVRGGSIFQRDRELRVASFLDVTDILKTEHALNENLKLAMMGQLATGIVHEINNPLATISAVNEALLARIPALRDLAENRGFCERLIDIFEDYLKIMFDESIRAGNIIKDLSDFARIRDYQFTSTDMEDLVRSTVRIMNVHSRFKGFQFQVRVEPEIPPVKADRDRIRQVLIILISNAIESMSISGVIHIHCGLLEDRTGVRISVVDRGEGLQVQDTERIFDPFFTTKEKRGGTGLGLSIADEIMTRHNGRIEARANEDIGMTFSIILPMEGDGHVKERVL